MKKIIAVFSVFALMMCGAVVAQNAPKGGNPSNGAKSKNAVKAKTMGKPRVPKKAAAVSPGNAPVAKPKLKTTK
jgi:uncharacterized protein YceK